MLSVYKYITPYLRKKKDILILGLIFLITIFITTNHNIKKDEFQNNQKELINNVFFQKTLKTIFSNLDQKFKNVNHKITDGETFDEILNLYSVNPSEIIQIKKILKAKINLNKLNINQNIIFIIDQEDNQIVKFVFPLSKTEEIYLVKSKDNKNFVQDIVVTKLNKKIIYAEDIINSSLYKAALSNDIPPGIIIDFASLYGFQVDFQRDIQKQDEFQILFEVFLNEKNQIMETGKIIFSNLKLSGQENSLYYFKDKEGNEGHYNKIGQSVKKALMKTPINGARLSSPYGMRKHPIDGYNKMHKGTDFAAPEGTPIMASGDGVILKAGWCGGGGNCIKIKHNATYQTVYAHMSKFARGMGKGLRVKQGQIIGFVGSTGKSTGPHLHYEVIRDGVRINSQKLKLPSGKVLKGENRIKFETAKIKIDVVKSEKIIGLN